MTADYHLMPARGPGRGGPRSGIPAKGDRPPFAPGNALTLRHGARAPRVYGALAQQLAAGLTEDRPDLAHYPEAVAAWATAEAQATLLRRHVAEHGWLDPDTGQPREGLLRWMRQFERAAHEQRATLGLDPRSEAALLRERAAASVLTFDLEALAARGRAVLAEREAAGLEPPPDVAGQVLAQVAAEGAAAMAEGARQHAEAAQAQTQDEDR